MIRRSQKLSLLDELGRFCVSLNVLFLNIVRILLKFPASDIDLIL